MKIKRVNFHRFIEKTCGYLANFSLFLNIFLPYLITRPVFAQDATPEPTPIIENTPVPTPEIIPEPTIEPTVAPTIEPTPEPVLTATPTAIPTEEPTITPEPTVAPTPTDTANIDIGTQAPVIEITPTPDIRPLDNLKRNSIATQTSTSCPLNPDNYECTANDVAIASASYTPVDKDTCDYPGDTIKVNLFADITSTASKRYDVGVWLYPMGNISSCDAKMIPIPPANNLDDDSCGDIESVGTLSDVPLGVVEFLCTDTTGDGFLDVPVVTTWDQNAGNTCNSGYQTLPGAPSKCKKDSAFKIPVPIPGQIIVKKVTNPANATQGFDFLMTGPKTDSFTLKNGENWDSGTVFTGGLPAGSYSLNETNPNGWKLDNVSCISSKGDNEIYSSISLQAGETVTCTFTNSLKTGQIIIKKDTNPVGSSEIFKFITTGVGFSGFSLTDGGSNNQVLSTGTYTVAETPVIGWKSSASCTSSLGDAETITSLKLDPGEIITCTFTNTKDATLTLVKTITNDNGGTATINDFQAKIDNNNVNWNTPIVVSATLHQASETNLPNYSAGVWGGDCAPDGKITLAPGDNKTCTITNDDVAPSLTLIKNVVKDNGGIAVATDWTLTATGPIIISGKGTVSSDSTFKAGTYTLTESGPSYYSAGDWSCVGGTQDGNKITVNLGQSVTCTVINDDNAPSLILNKIVINDNGGTASESDWILTANGGDAGILSGVGDSGNTDVVSGTMFKAGTYTLSESSAISGYTSSGWTCIKNSGQPYSTGSITLALGDIATCTITNDDIAPKLTIVKDVVNDDGGKAQPDDFKLTVGGTQVSSGIGNTYTANIPYAINETQLTGYTFTSITGDTKCPTSLGGTITLSPGDDITCTIKNDDNESSITLNKIVDNNYGGTAGIDDFELSIGGTSVNSGQKLVLDSNQNYIINEVGLSGYEFVSIVGDTKCPSVLGGSISLTTGENIICTITNRDIQPKLTLTKTVINNNGGNKQVSDFPLLVNQIGVASGVKNGFNAGTYTASEISQSGYTASIWGGDCTADGSITLQVGDDKSCTITNDDQAATLLVTKTVVNNNGGTKSASDFIINIGNTNVSPSTFPGAIGTTVTLDAGPYSVDETGISGYLKTLGDYCSGTVANGETKSCTITNDDIAPSLTLNKIVINDNGGTAAPTDWLLTATGPTTIFGAGGTASGPTFSAGTYKLSESTGPLGYSSSSWTCVKNQEEFSASSITLNLGDIATCTITNDDIAPPTATISKSNDASGDKSPGSSVGFKIKVTILENDINNLIVTDLPSEGFVYRPGSWSVLKNSNPLAITEPEYHSPGQWKIGDVKAGDVLELTYLADINNNQQPGIYKDLAYAQGVTSYDNTISVIATSEALGYVNENLVGTEVSIVKNTQNSVSAGIEKEVEGKVLGVSTELPYTGANTIWLFISAILSLVGLFLIKKSSFKFFSILLIIFFSFFTPKIQAIDTLSVRLEQPKSPTNLNDLKLTFVALEINGVNPIIVKCYKKTPSDGGYSQFGSNISLSAPGNTAQCQADSSILNFEGTYNFYVTANGEQSNIVSFDYKTSSPGTPSDYRKEWLNGGCDYKIHFKTADDGGKTVKVELYRSDSTSFTLDDNSKVASVNITSNQDSSITNSVPDCSKGYYYVLRAFDNAGNGSGTIGDSVTVIKTSTTVSTITNTGAIPVTNATIAPEEENTTLTGTTALLEENPTTGEEGAVLGITNTNKSFIQKYWLPLLLGLIGLFIIIRYVLSKKKKSLR